MKLYDAERILGMPRRQVLELADRGVIGPVTLDPECECADTIDPGSVWRYAEANKLGPWAPVLGPEIDDAPSDITD